MTDPGRFYKPGVPMRPQRTPLQIPVRYHVIGDDWSDGVTENISGTGVLIRAPQTASVGREVDLILTVPAGVVGDLAGEIFCAGAIVRVVPAVDNGRPGFAVVFRKCRPTVASRNA